MVDRYCNVCGEACKDPEFFDVDGADYCSRACYDSAQPDPPEPAAPTR